MIKLAYAAIRRPKLAIAIWLLATVVLISQIGSLEQRLVQPNYDVPGTENAEATGLIDNTFGANLQFPILLTGPPSVLDRRGPRYADHLERRGKTSVLSPWDGRDSRRLLRPRPGAAMLIAIVDEPASKGLKTAEAIEKEIDKTVRPPLKAHITGQQTIGLAMQNEALASAEEAEFIALPLLLFVLLIVFRSVVAALIPALFGALVVAAGFGALSILAALGPLAASALSLSSMMGLALGVDYSLLIVARFREELAAGNDPEDGAAAALRAATTAGRTVVFAALTLSTAMVAGLLLAPGSFLVSAVVGVAVAVALSAVSAIIVIPAVLALLGPKIDKWPIGRRARGKSGGVAATAGKALRRPAVAALVVLIPLVLLGRQALAIDPGTPGVDLLPKDDRARKDFEAVTRALGPGWSVPFEVVSVADKGPITERSRLRQLDRFQSRIARDPDVALVMGPNAVSRRTAAIRRLPEQIEGVQKTLAVGRRATARLDSNLSRAEDGVRDFRGGIGQAASAARRLARGGGQARDGAGQIADGLALASAGADRFLAVLTEIEHGAKRIEGGAGKAASGAGTIADGLSRARSGVSQAIAPQQQLANGLRSGAHDLERLREPAQIADTDLRRAFRLLTTMTTGRLDPNYKGAVEAVGEASGAVSGRHPLTGQRVEPGYDGLDASLAQGSRELGSTATKVEGMISSTRELASGLARLERGAHRLDSGLVRLRTGAEKLASGITRVRTAVSGDLGQIERLASGARELEDGIRRLSAGTTLLSDGLHAGEQQSQPLESGLARMDAGVVRFRGRLPDGSSTAGLSGRASDRTFNSGNAVLAAIDGARRDQRQQAAAVVSVDTGGRAARILVIPKTGSSSPATADLRDRLSRLGDDFQRRTGLDTAVGGEAALVLEYDSAVSKRVLPLVVAFVIVTYLVLIPFFRALLLPLIAVVLNVLTAAAAAGVLVIAFQGDTPLGGPGYIDAIVMLGIFGIVFGLSIDYEVFLLGRMREGWLRTRNLDSAIKYGLDRTAGVVTGAAAIMLAVFFAFSLSAFVPNRQFGVGLFVAVLIDATVVRLVLLPAAMKLCGRATWWIPAWLDRILPRIAEEGPPRAAEPKDPPVVGARGRVPAPADG